MTQNTLDTGAARPAVRPICPVIDAHTHFGRLLFGEAYEDTYDTRAAVDAMRRSGVERAVVLELEWEAGYERLLKKLEPAGDFLIPFGSVDISKAMRPDFERIVYRQILDLKAKGCRGIKLWKDITLYGMKYFGRELRLDDSRLSPLFECCAQERLPVVIHVADPPCFFEPITPENEHFVCLSRHPEWSFYGKTSFSFADHMDMQENMLRSHPQTTFVVAHVGSWAENLPEVGRWLDAYPNLFIDISARLDQLGRRPYTGRAFMEAYQDRILFGTDFEATFSPARTASFYETHYRFLQAFD